MCCCYLPFFFFFLPQELRDLRKHIRSCFGSIEGFLLPHPGLRVATDPDFDGRLRDIEPTFLENLSRFVPMLLAPDKVVARRIGGSEVSQKKKKKSGGIFGWRGGEGQSCHLA